MLSQLITSMSCVDLNDKNKNKFKLSVSKIDNSSLKPTTSVTNLPLYGKTITNEDKK
jgi:hypothetical protein